MSVFCKQILHDEIIDGDIGDNEQNQKRRRPEFMDEHF